MRRFLLLFSVAGLVLLTACATGALAVHNGAGKVVGSISVQGTRAAAFLGSQGNIRGRVRGNVVRDDAGKNLGTIEEQGGHTVILDPKENALGTLEHGTDCYGKGQEKLGSVTAEAEASVAAAACLVFFLR